CRTAGWWGTIRSRARSTISWGASATAWSRTPACTMQSTRMRPASRSRGRVGSGDSQCSCRWRPMPRKPDGEKYCVMCVIALSSIYLHSAWNDPGTEMEASMMRGFPWFWRQEGDAWEAMIDRDEPRGPREGRRRGPRHEDFRFGPGGPGEPGGPPHGGPGGNP